MVSESYVAEADVFDESWVHVHSLYDLFEDLYDYAIDSGVLEATLLSLCQGGTDSKSDDHIVWVLLSSVVNIQSEQKFPKYPKASNLILPIIQAISEGVLTWH
jgi:hypothetical protein